MLNLKVGEALIYDFKEKYKIILRKEENCYYLVNPINLKKIKLNIIGAFIFNCYMNNNSRQEIIKKITSLIELNEVNLTNDIVEFENYLIAKGFGEIINT